MKSQISKEDLERHWVGFQLDVASLRPALGPLYNAAFRGRRGHTFLVGEQPAELGVGARMWPSADEPNGVPEVFGAISNGAYSARLVSVACAATILLWLDGAIQEFARLLGHPRGIEMCAGDFIAVAGVGVDALRASTLIWASGNNIRHVDEWFATADAYRNPVTARDVERRDRQERSMKPLADLLGIALPVTENVAFESFQTLSAVDDVHGSFDQLELHVLRIGQDLVQRSGLTGAPIGVSVVAVVPISDVPADRRIIRDGMARSASGAGDSKRILNIRPLT